MAAEVTKHGLSGYRKGCHCETCRAGKRDYMREYRARRREAEVADANVGAEPLLDDGPLRDPVAAAGSLDMAAPAGPLEQALLEDLAHPDEKVAFRRHLVGIGRLNARVLDQISRLDRLDLISPVQLRQMEVLGRLARLGFAGLEDELEGGHVEVPDDASALMDELAGGAGADEQGR